ncbi:MAG: hypothetical protein ACR2P1_22965, partial [Pseudomonadales bacterium]
AVIVATEAVNLDDLREHCSDAGLAKAKWPEFMTETDLIPLSAIGKVVRAELEELVQQRIESGQSS